MKPDGGHAQDVKINPEVKRRIEEDRDRKSREGISDGDAPRPEKGGSKRSGKPREPRRQPVEGTPTDGATQPETDEKQPDKPPGRSKGKGRAARFQRDLTEPSRPAAWEAKEEPSSSTSRYHRDLPKADDLTSRLTRELSVRPYADCLICFAAIHPMQPTWSCSPLLPISAATDDEDGGKSGNVPPRAAESAQCCWTTFHLKCIRSWAEKSVRDLEAAWRARGEERKGEWRCPGCQSKRSAIPASYWYVLCRIYACGIVA